MVSPSESGLTALDLVQSDVKDYVDVNIGLTQFGRKRVKEIISEVSGMQ
jgi:hypothetical protein